MPVRRRALLAAACVVAYFLVSYAVIVLAPPGPVSFYATLPAQALVIAWNPVLQPLGLVEGSWLVAPTVPACLAIVLLYGALAYGIVLLAAGRRGRGR